MSKIIDNFHKNKIIFWILGPFSFILIMFMNIPWFRQILCIEHISDNEIYHYLKPVIILTSFTILIISLFQFKRIKQIKLFQFVNDLFYFFRPFYINCNKEWQKPFVVILFLILIPGGIFTFFYYFQLLSSSAAFESYNFFDQLSYVLAYLGLLLTIRVYYEVKEGHTESIEDFIKILTKVLDLSDKDDKIVIYAPTLFLNETHIIKKTATYKSTSYRGKIADKSNITLHLLDINNSLNSFSENISVKSLKHTDNESKINTFKESNCELNQFHKWSLKSELEDNYNDTDTRNKYYRGFISFMKSISASKIKFDYKLYNHDKINFNNIVEARGSFAVANFAKGLYFLGSFDALNNAEPHFRGTFFINKNIKQNELKNLITAITQ